MTGCKISRVHQSLGIDQQTPEGATSDRLPEGMDVCFFSSTLPDDLGGVNVLCIILIACQMTVIVGDSGLWLCRCMTSNERY